MPKVTSSGKPKKEETIRLGANLWDLEKIEPSIRAMILGGKLDTTEAILVDKHRTEETALAFTCDLLTAALAIDVLRSEQRRTGEPPIRAYIYRKTWARIPSAQVLTVMENGKAVLDSEFFAIEEELLPPVPLMPEKLIIGKS